MKVYLQKELWEVLKDINNIKSIAGVIKNN